MCICFRYPVFLKSSMCRYLSFLSETSTFVIVPQLKLSKRLTNLLQSERNEWNLFIGPTFYIAIRPWQMNLAVMYVHVLLFYSIFSLTYFHIKIFCTCWRSKKYHTRFFVSIMFIWVSLSMVMVSLI